MDPTQQSLAWADAALLTCSLCEWLHTLEDEIKLIWKGSRNVSQVCYLLGRYICIGSFVVFLMGDVPYTTLGRDELFLQNPGVTHWLLNINLVFVEIIFSLRTWALWEQSRRMTIVLGVLLVLMWISTFTLLGMFAVTQVGILGYSYFISLTIFYLIITILVIVKASQAIRSPGKKISGFVRLVHAQGVTYYTFLFAASLAALVIVLLGGASSVMIVARVLQFAFTHMACRMTLSLRSEGSRTVIPYNTGECNSSEQETTIPLSPLNFRHMSRGTAAPTASRHGHLTQGFEYAPAPSHEGPAGV